jgi:hypothetical protein
LRYWLCSPSLSAHLIGELLSLYTSSSVVGCAFANPTLAPVRNGVKGMACDICPRCCVGYIGPGCYGDVRRSPFHILLGRISWVFGIVLALLLGEASQGLRVADVDATLPQLHDPFALEPPQCPVHRHALRPYHGAQFLVSVGGR